MLPRCVAQGESNFFSISFFLSISKSSSNGKSKDHKLLRNDLAFAEETSDTLIQAFSFVGFGSALEHGSESHLGATLDIYTIAILSYVAHQAGTSEILTTIVANDRLKQKLARSHHSCFLRIKSF